MPARLKNTRSTRAKRIDLPTESVAPAGTRRVIRRHRRPALAGTAPVGQAHRPGFGLGKPSHIPL